MPRTLLVLTFTLSLPFTSRAADWAEFRGPDGTGHYSGPPLVTAWGPDKNVAWKTPIPGKGWSSPIVVKGKIFLTTAVPLTDRPRAALSLRAVCLDAASGTIIWDRQIFVEDSSVAPPHSKNSHASPTPVSDGEHVWVHFGHMGTACLDFAGNVVWKSQKFPYQHQHGNGGSPILVGDKLVFSCDGTDEQFVVALDKKTGDVRWKTDRGWRPKLGFSFATAQAITANGKTLVVSPASDYVAAYDAADGKEVWRVKYPAAGWSVIPRPVVGGGLVFVCTGYVTAHLIAIDPAGTGDLTKNVKWQARRNAANTPTPLVVGEELYMLSDQGFLTCYDAKTGQVHWSERVAGRAYSASPIYADGKLYLTSEDGVGQVVAAGKQFKEISKSEMKEKTFATFAAVDGALYVRTETTLYRFGR
jgi:outer membrane protein assembly factor BamB